MMKTIIRTMTVITVLVAFLFLSSPRIAKADVCTWNWFETGNWNDSSKWSCNIVPGADDDAIINNGTVTLTADVIVASLTMSGGILTGDYDLTADTINWSSGTMSGSGTITATLAANFTGSSAMTLQDRTFNNAGSATWNRTGYLNLSTNSTIFNNQAGATFTVTSSGTTLMGGSGTFNNLGTFTKASTGETKNNQFDNSGLLRVESGTLELYNGYRNSDHTGTYQILSGAILRLSGLAHNLSGDITGTGSGTIEIYNTVNISGTFTFSGTTAISGSAGSTLNLSTAATNADTAILNLSAGTLTGSGDLTADTINWSGGTMSGSGTITATLATNFTGSSAMTLQDRTFNNVGAANWNRTGYINLSTNSTIFNNQSGATFTVTSSGSTLVSGLGTFNNAGTLNLTTGEIKPATFVQESGGITNMAIKGITPLTDYPQINAPVVDLTGPLNISFSGGYTPQIGDHFILLSYSSTRSGDFSPVNVPPLADGVWDLFYKDMSLHLWAVIHTYLPMIIG